MMKFAATQRISRRGFLAQSLATGVAFMIVPRRVLGGAGHTSPNDELTKAVIGVGGMGTGHLDYPGSRLVAVCDVDANHLRKAMTSQNGVRGYRDFRELLAQPDIDIVHIATPPHWHGLISIMAAQAGKDIWCEKPMTRTLIEGRKVVEAVRRHGRMFRINTWFRFQGDFYDFGSTVKPIKKLVASGMLGWPLKVTVGAATGFNWKSHWNGRTDLKPQPVPPQLDYDLWLGPAPFKPYHPHRVHSTFRGYWDYENGGQGDMGQHYLDPVQYILGKDETSPVWVDVDAPQQHPDAVGTFRRISLKYADGCEIVCDDTGNNQHVPFIEGPQGKLFRGMDCTVPGWKRKLDALPDPEPQTADFSESVRTRRPFALNELNGFRSCTLVNIAAAAWRLGRGFRFDPVTLRANDDAANRFFDQPMRAPWHL